MEKVYEIMWLRDSVYAVTAKDSTGEVLFSGSISDVSAWIDLKEKGFHL
jgi:hypothetical protein